MLREMVPQLVLWDNDNVHILYIQLHAYVGT